MKTIIAIAVDTDGLQNFEDSYLAALWHAAQANPAPAHDRDAGELADAIGREIIKRWLASAPAMLFEHRQEMHYWHTLQQHGNWAGPAGTWQPHPTRHPTSGPGTCAGGTAIAVDRSGRQAGEDSALGASQGHHAC